MLESIIQELECLQEKHNRVLANEHKIVEHDAAVAYYRRQLKDMGVHKVDVNFAGRQEVIEKCALNALTTAYTRAWVDKRVEEITDNRAKAMLT